jgi:hypothetical protein
LSRGCATGSDRQLGSAETDDLGQRVHAARTDDRRADSAFDASRCGCAVTLRHLSVIALGVAEAEYWEPATDSVITVRGVGEEQVVGLLAAVVAIRSGRGHPAIQLNRPDGSSLSIATDGTRCALVGIDSLGESFHSTGGMPGPLLCFDYHGSWSEAPAEWAIPASDALSCARRSIRHGTPDTEAVLFEPD